MLALVLVVVLTESDETTSTMLLELRSRKFLLAVLTIKEAKLLFFPADVDGTGGVVTFDGQILLFYYYCYVKKKGLFSD